MSIIQVMDSSKSGRAIYIVAAGLIVVNTVITILNLLQWEIILTIESSAGLVPIIGLLSLLLWITQPDRRAVERSVMKHIYKMKELAQVKVRMASTLLYIMPWESSPNSAYTIEEFLRNDLERTLRSPELKEQIDNYKQAFWLRLLTPFSLVTMVAFYQIPLWVLIPGGIFIGFVLAHLLLKECQNTPIRVLEYAFARWFHEGASTDLSRRKSGFGRKSDVRERLEATLEIVTPTIDLAVRGDWRGFDRNSRNLEELLGIPKPECLSWRLVNEYLRLLQWNIGSIHGPNSQRVDISLQNAELQITDSITSLRKNRELQFSEEEETIAKVMIHLTKNSANRDTLLNLSSDFYNVFDGKIFAYLPNLSFTILKDIPFALHNLSTPKLSGSLTEVEQLSFYLVAAAEQELLDMLSILKTVFSWKTHPSKLESALGPIAAKCILENDIGWNIDEIHAVVHIIAPKLYLVDFDKMIRNLGVFRKRVGEASYHRFLTNLRYQISVRLGSSSDTKSLNKILANLDDYIAKQAEDGD